MLIQNVDILLRRVEGHFNVGGNAFGTYELLHELFSDDFAALLLLNVLRDHSHKHLVSAHLVRFFEIVMNSSEFLERILVVRIVNH